MLKGIMARGRTGEMRRMGNEEDPSCDESMGGGYGGGEERRASSAGKVGGVG